MDLLETLKHRHIVAFPLFALAVVATGFLGSGKQMTGTLTSDYLKVDSTSEQVITFPNSSVRAIVFKGSDFEFWNERPILRDGSMLLGSHGLTTVYADRAEVRGIDGIFHVSVTNGNLAVAAVTTPVSVRVGQESLAIPIGYQWRAPAGRIAGREEGWEQWLSARKPMLAPKKFVRDMKDKWNSLPPSGTTVESVRSGSLWIFPWQFQAARQRFYSFWTQGVLARIGAFVQGGDAASLQAFLLNPDIQNAVQASAERVTTIASYLGEATKPAIVNELLPLVSDSADTVLLASLHPDLRSSVWSQAVRTDAAEDSDIARMVSLPFSDIGEEALPKALLDQWGVQLSGVLMQLGNERGNFLSALLPSLAHLSQTFEKTGYPERAENYRTIVMTLASAYQADLSFEARSLLAGFSAQNVASLVSLPEVLPPHAAAPTPKLPTSKTQTKDLFLPQVAEKMKVTAKEALHKAGAAFSLKTSIEAVSPNTVKVTGLIFSNKKTDRTFDFLWNQTTGEVSQIVVSGRKSPYPQQFGAFVKWARGK